MRSIYRVIISLVDILIAPFLLLSAILMKMARKYIVGFWEDYSYFRVSRTIFDTVGVFPLDDHYYEPAFKISKCRKIEQPRYLPGVDLNEKEQLYLLSIMNFSQELHELSQLPKSELTYSFDKGPFRSGDSDYLYSFIRLKKPSLVIEVGCGHSSLLIQHAFKKIKEEDSAFFFEHICIEPYENPWLSKLNVTVKKEVIESLPISYFNKLKPGDILFIDSSHVIRPEGDVLYMVLELLPSLPVGTYVHFHDIFTPNNYLKEWSHNGMVFWNEQYILEAYLSNNDKYKIIGALNYLKNTNYEKLKHTCPFLTSDREPGSIWLEKIA